MTQNRVVVGAGVAQSGAGRKFPSIFFASGRSAREPAARRRTWKYVVLHWVLFWAIWRAVALNCCPALPVLTEDITMNSYSCPCQPSTESGFYYTFSVWDKAAFHLAALAVFCLHAPVNDLLHIGGCWAKVQIKSCHLTTITPFSGNWSVFLWAFKINITLYM